MEPELLQQGLWDQFVAEGWTMSLLPERHAGTNAAMGTLAETHRDIASFVLHVGCLCRAGHYVQSVECRGEANGAYALSVRLGFRAPRVK